MRIIVKPHVDRTPKHTTASRMVAEANKSPGKGGAPREGTKLPTEHREWKQVCDTCGQRSYRLFKTLNGWQCKYCKRER